MRCSDFLAAVAAARAVQRQWQRVQWREQTDGATPAQDGAGPPVAGCVDAAAAAPAGGVAGSSDAEGAAGVSEYADGAAGAVPDTEMELEDARAELEGSVGFVAAEDSARDGLAPAMSAPHPRGPAFGHEARVGDWCVVGLEPAGD
jgi:hypothetical protein